MNEQFLIYLIRWIVSAFVMMLPLHFLIKWKCCIKMKYMEHIHLIIIQITGAFIFYNIDKLIFKG